MKETARAIGAFIFGVFLASMLGHAIAAIINPLPYIFQNGTTADATQVNADLAQIVSNVNTNAVALANSALVPSGAVEAFNLGSCPTGWIIADGTGGTPDMRGYFVRGLDTGGSVDPGRSLATLQQDQIQDHTHTYSSFSGLNAAAGGGSLAGSAGATTSIPNSGNHGAETRPKNVALLYCQKS